MTKKAADKSKTSSTSERGRGGELQEHVRDEHATLTTNQGVPISDNQNSLRASERGPTLLEDFILREKITHFDHERIPERIVHARGSAAHGTFTLTKSLAKYTRARILTEVGEKTPIFVRFSTVAGGAGSVDTPRDVRGFAIKFYTQEGNWDLVGNNVPVFFIQDAIKFPDLVHAVKMEPDRGFPQSATAHDTFWDFISLTPESMHMVLWIMSDRTIPRAFGTIDGFGVHTFRLLNDQDEVTFVKFHWRPEAGLQSTVWDEAVKMAGADPDSQRRQLFEAIQAGKGPAWEFGVQLFTEEQAAEFPFDVLDPTKIIPEETVPVEIIGRFELDRWPDNFFAETEQVAFCPSHLVPGIDFSEDPLLQGRLFSYLDTQLSRLGTPNFHQLPINAPKCPFANLQRDGKMQMHVHKGRVNYEPSSLDRTSPRQSPEGFRSAAVENATSNDVVSSARAPAAFKLRARSPSFADHYSQARLFYRSQAAVQQAHIASSFVFELSKVETPHVRRAIVAHLRHVDEDLARRVGDGLGFDELPEAPPAAAAVIDLDTSPALDVTARWPETLDGRAVGILVADGSDRKAVEALRDAAVAEGATVKVIAPRIGGIEWADGSKSDVDAHLPGTPSVFFDAVAVILSKDAGKKLSAEGAAVDFVRDAYGHLKTIAHDAGGQALLDRAHAEADDGVVEASDVTAFVAAAKKRHWAREPNVRTLA